MSDDVICMPNNTLKVVVLNDKAVIVMQTPFLLHCTNICSLVFQWLEGILFSRHTYDLFCLIYHYCLQHSSDALRSIQGQNLTPRQHVHSLATSNIQSIGPSTRGQIWSQASFSRRVKPYHKI